MRILTLIGLLICLDASAASTVGTATATVVQLSPRPRPNNGLIVYPLETSRPTVSRGMMRASNTRLTGALLYRRTHTLLNPR